MFGSNALAAAIMALPLLSSAAPAQAVEKRTPSAKFNLKTKVISGATTEGLEGYIQGYHTGAGENAATITTNETNIPLAYLEDGYLEFDLSGSTYNMILPQTSTYDDWIAAEINAFDASNPGPFTSGSGAFYMDSSNNILFNNLGSASDPTANATESYFKGWLACFWSHGGDAQLFYKFEALPQYPANCASVNLVAEYVPA